MKQILHLAELTVFLLDIMTSTSPSPGLGDAGEKYKVLKKIGEGAQGIILKAELKDKPGSFVAVKKMRQLNRAETKNGISMDTIREIYMLRELDHENVISILDIFSKSGVLYIIMPFACGDLDELIRNKDIMLTPGHTKQYMLQLLKGCEYIHNKFILHRDLKPQNCLILSNSTLKISDFGLSREYGSPNRILSYQACTIWYRSPELLFGANYYGVGLDIWSIGCIFGELMLRCPVFGGNDNTEIAQIGRIFRILGTPNYSPQDLTSNDSDNKASQHPNYWKDYELLPKFRKYEPNESFPINNLFKAHSNAARDLFLNLCKYDPNKRLTTTQALKHEYFKENPKPTTMDKLPNPKSATNGKSKKGNNNNKNRKMEID